MRRNSRRRLLAKPTSERIAAVGPAACAPVFTGVCGKAPVPERSPIPPVCQQSAQLNFKCAGGEASICLRFFPRRFAHNSQKQLISFPACVFIAPFLLVSSCQPYLPSSLITPPALLLLSRPSWGAQYDGDGDAPHGVCVMSHTLQRLYSSTLFFNPCARRPHCYFQIL